MCSGVCGLLILTVFAVSAGKKHVSNFKRSLSFSVLRIVLRLNIFNIVHSVIRTAKIERKTITTTVSEEYSNRTIITSVAIYRRTDMIQQ